MSISTYDTGSTMSEGDFEFRGRRPIELGFGTSGLRGLVTDITDLEAYINTRGFIEYLVDNRELAPGGSVAIAGDLRPSTDRILHAVARAIVDCGYNVANLGRIPTPALAYYAMQQGWPSIMVTGSHIPFDRNGIKFNKPSGEVLKADEAAILTRLTRVRRQEYGRSAVDSVFGDDGMFKPDAERLLPPPLDAAREEYVRRYLDFFEPGSLDGNRLVVYEHSAVGRDLLAEVLERLGAQVVRMHRSDDFVAIDTEAVTEEQLRLLQSFADEARAAYGPINAIVSTDGDSDRPLLLACDDDGNVRFVNGDLLGIVVADSLQADDIAVPVSASDAVERHFSSHGVNVTRTKIGSPHVITAMHAGHGARRVGWEANGGFLTGSDIKENGHVLTALPTRDATLPLLAVLVKAALTKQTVLQLVDRLPTRWPKAGLIDNFSPETSRALLGWLSPTDERVIEAVFSDEGVVVEYSDDRSTDAPADLILELRSARRVLSDHFAASRGFSDIGRLNFLDGIRVHFVNGDIAHIRPSGNAPQLRCYAVADTETRAGEIVELAIREPNGILRELESRVNEVSFVEAIRNNIALTHELFSAGQTPDVIATVSGSKDAQAFWQHHLNVARESFRTRLALSFHEDLPVNQAFGTLLLWQRLRQQLKRGESALAAFVFGEGTRASPFTETENGQKAAIATFATALSPDGTRYLPMVELAMRCFVPVEQYLRRSGFEGMVIKWGDEIQIPTRDLSAEDPLFDGADVVRFVSVRPMNDDEARNKDWVGVDSHGHVTAFIPRRPLDQMEKLADRGLLQRRAGSLWGGINLGSIAISYVFLDSLLGEFSAEVNDPAADRRTRPDLDPQFFTALMIATIDDEVARESEWRTALDESDAIRKLDRDVPGILSRLRRVVEVFERTHSRKPRIVAMDFGTPYWGDIGQHSKIHDFFMALNHRGPLGDIARAITGMTGERDASGNIFIGETIVSRDVTVRDSVLINAQLLGEGLVERCVLVGTRAGVIRARDAFDVLSTVSELHLEPRSGTYKVISQDGCHLGGGERSTTLFGSDRPLQMRVEEHTDLRDRAQNYDQSILENPMSFRDAHELMSRLSPEAVASDRETVARSVWEAVKDKYGRA